MNVHGLILPVSFIFQCIDGRYTGSGIFWERHPQFVVSFIGDEPGVFGHKNTLGCFFLDPVFFFFFDKAKGDNDFFTLYTELDLEHYKRQY